MNNSVKVGYHYMFFGPTLTQVPECFIRDVEVCKSIAIVHIAIVHIAIVTRDLAAAACKLLRFACIILAVSLYCLALCYHWL